MTARIVKTIPIVRKTPKAVDTEKQKANTSEAGQETASSTDD